MSQILALRRGLVYEGDENFMHAIHPLPTITEASCEFYENPIGHPGINVVFREDSFDPVTRIRRGRFYCDAGGLNAISQDRVHNHPYGPNIGSGGQQGWKAERYLRRIGDEHLRKSTRVDGSQVWLGAGNHVTRWRVVSVEKISTDHLLFTLRAVSLVGVVPELAEVIHDKDGGDVSTEPIRQALDALVDALHKQQATPIVDVARETARLVLATWAGEAAMGDDLGDVVKKIRCSEGAPPDPASKCVTRWAGSIVSRLHPRGKSAEQERQTSKGLQLRTVVDEDAECAVHLVGLLLREIGWAKV
jgi:hypothetical protein